MICLTKNLLANWYNICLKCNFYLIVNQIHNVVFIGIFYLDLHFIIIFSLYSALDCLLLIALWLILLKLIAYFMALFLFIAYFMALFILFTTAVFV